jgi:hypothetical protein
VAKAPSISAQPVAVPMQTPATVAGPSAEMARPAPVMQQSAPRPLPLVEPTTKLTAEPPAKAVATLAPASVTGPPPPVVQPVAKLTPAPLATLAPVQPARMPRKRIEPLPNTAASKLRYQIETVCGREAWEVRVVVKPDQLMHVTVKVADVEASGALAEKITALPEMAAPNVRLEIEPFDKTVVVPVHN